MNWNGSLLTRRGFLASAGLLAVGVSGCSLTDDDDPESTPELESTEAPEVEPTPTQDVIASPVAGYPDPERWAGRVLNVAGWGGTYQAAQREAFFDPFAAATGATVQEKVADLASLQDQVDNDEVVWDVLTAPMEQVFRLQDAGAIQPIDYDVVDQVALFSDIVQEYGVGTAYFSSTIIHATPPADKPLSWADVWSVDPATPEAEIDPLQQRCLRRSPIGTLEFALLADGVEVGDLYPLNVDRAFASLDRLRENVLVWWQESKEPVELVSVEQVGLASAWNSRVEDLDLDEQVQIEWNQGMLSADAWIVPTGAANPDLAMDFVNFATRAIPTANFSRLVSYGPVNTDAFDYVREDRIPRLPSAPQNREVQFVQNWAYWAENESDLTKRFEDWLLGPDEEATPTT